MPKFVYDFAEGNKDLKDLLGGKGANLAEMTNLGLPVPPGFTITTEACVEYLDDGWPAGLDEEIADHVARLEAAMGRRFGDPADPLLLSVRSGAKFSMPGMMDTILNLGLNEESVDGLAEVTGHQEFAADCYRRLQEMYESTVGDDLPEDPADQLRAAIEAVFGSWNTPRADAYRRREGIPDDLGTAVSVQVMVFGNRDDRSGTGVGFTRDPATGESGLYGDFLVNAQGEDVVAGIRTPQPLTRVMAAGSGSDG
ncbi:MAG TPA: PEP/pyruvate-binding domain-containing protein, partial [Mycobacteriales bacterium]|nr:PEP/pyruvate-binding domain-containing protein [Mycobacteriales bacterium]